jgi:hypothetical protein
LSHPAVTHWLKQADGAQTSNGEILVDETALSVAEVAERTGLSLELLTGDLDGPLAAALVPAGHVSASAFAELASAELEDVLAATRGELAAAVTSSGRLDLAHPAALAFMAGRPFARKRDGDPVIPDIGGQGYLAAARVGDDVDLEHPIARCFLARCLGRVTDAAGRHGSKLFLKLR